jgi:hypothetical protein
MAKRKYYLDTRVLTAFFFAAMPFVAFGSFIVVNMAKNELRDSVGTGLEQRAVQTKLALERHVSEQVLNLRSLGLEPEVQKALQKPGPPISELEAQRLEDAWRADSDPKLRAAILSSPLSARLRTVSSLRPGLRAIQIVDRSGRVIAASGRGGRLTHADTAWFKELSAQEGQAQAWIGDIERPQGHIYTSLEIAYPVWNDDVLFEGAVRGLLDATDLYSVLAPVRVGRTGHATLIRATDGMILGSDEGDRILTTVYPGFGSLAGALAGFPIAPDAEALFGKSRMHRGYWTLQPVTAEVEGHEVVVEPSRLVGFSPIDQVPGVEWLVVVEQDLEEALHPIAGVTRYLWMHFLGVFATVILLALYFSFKLEQPVMDDDLHLHEEHIPASQKARTEADRDE